MSVQSSEPDPDHHYYSRIGDTRTAVNQLTDKLQVTNRNLASVDKMLGQYRNIGEHQSRKINRLSEDVNRTQDYIDEERHRNRPSRDMAHRSPSREYGNSPSRPTCERVSRRSPVSVRFHDDMDSSPPRRRQSLATWPPREPNNTGHESVPELHTVGAAVSSLDARLATIQAELSANRVAVQEQGAGLSGELRRALSHDGLVSSCAGEGPYAPAAAATYNAAPAAPLVTAPAATDLGQASRVSELEAACEQLRGQLTRSRRDLEQAAGGRDALRAQMEELCGEVSRSQQAAARLQSVVDSQHSELSEAARSDADRRAWASERRRLEDELHSVRAALSDVETRESDVMELRRRVEQAEHARRERDARIEELSGEVEARTTAHTKAAAALADVGERLAAEERGRRALEAQLEDMAGRLCEAGRARDAVVSELAETRDTVAQGERRRQDVLARAQDTVRQWKVRCKKLEAECARGRGEAEGTGERADHLAKEVDQLRAHALTGVQHTEHLKRELADILAVRAQQDEQLRMRDIDCNELKAVKLDLESELRDLRQVVDKMETDLRAEAEQSQRLLEERARMEDSCGRTQQQLSTTQQQLSSCEQLLHDATTERAELTQQLADMATDRSSLRSRLEDATRHIHQMAQERDVMAQHHASEVTSLSERVTSLTSEVEAARAREGRTTEDVARRWRVGQAEVTAEIQMLRHEREGHQDDVTSLRRECEQLRQDVTSARAEKLHVRVQAETVENALLSSERASAEAEREREAARADVAQTQARLAEAERAAELAAQAADTQLGQLLAAVHDKIESLVVDVAHHLLGEHTPFTSLVNHTSTGYVDTPTNHVNREAWLADVCSKLDWLRLEFTELRATELKLRNCLRGKVVAESQRGEELINREILKQNKVLDELSQKRRKLAESIEQKRKRLEKGEKNARNLQTGHTDVMGVGAKKCSSQGTVCAMTNQSEEQWKEAPEKCVTWRPGCLATDQLGGRCVEEAEKGAMDAEAGALLEQDLSVLHESLLAEQEGLMQRAVQLEGAAGCTDHQERERIHARFAHLQDTINLLKSDLTDTDKIGDLFRQLCPDQLVGPDPPSKIVDKPVISVQYPDEGFK